MHEGWFVPACLRLSGCLGMVVCQSGIAVRRPSEDAIWQVLLCKVRKRKRGKAPALTEPISPGSSILIRVSAEMEDSRRLGAFPPQH